MRIVVVTNPAQTMLTKYDPNSKLQADATCKAVSNALSELGHSVQIIEAGPGLWTELEEKKPDAAFNIATGYHNKKQQANIAAILQLSGIPFTGSGPKAHTIGLLKHMSKMSFVANQVPTPGFFVLNNLEELDNNLSLNKIDLPVIVKPAAEGSSVGISSSSVTEDPQEMKRLAADLLRTLEPPVLVEEFVAGREFTVAIMGYPEPVVLPVEEIIFGEETMYTYGVKVKDNVTTVCPAEIPEELTRAIEDTALKAFNAIGCRDIARVDMRVSEEGVPLVLEINTLPGLMPGYSEVPRIAEKAGISYPELIDLILQGALSRRAACNGVVQVASET